MLRSAAVLVVVALMGACGAGDDDSSVDVFAAASLTDAFEAVAEAFEAGHPGVDVRLNFAGSSALREQILSGAPADVFASANPATMATVVDDGRVESSAVFATNRLQIAVPAGNPAGISGLADFADADRLIGLCAAAVPCGDFGRQVLASAGVVASVDTEEPDVRSLLLKVGEGELDAGLVYATDVAATEEVDGVDLPDEWNVVAELAIGVVDAHDADQAAAFVAFVLGEGGRSILAEHGFGLP